MNEPRTAIVTGGGTGIGKAAAAALISDGWRVIITGRREERLHEAAAEIGDEAIPMVSDVTSEASVVALFTESVKLCGRVDLLFNNAGIGAPANPIEDLSLDQWQAVVDVNLTGSFLCARQAFRVMKDQQPNGGRIINNGSVSAYAPRPHSAPYTATKHAVSGLTRALSLDGRRHNIACGQIDIGNAATEMTIPMANGVPQADGTVREEARMDVKDVGKAIVYMASLPLEANVLFMTVMANRMPFVGRG